MYHEGRLKCDFVLEFVPEDKEDGGHREFGFDDERNKEEPGYYWTLPLYEIEKDKLYLNNIYNYLLTVKEE